MRKGNNMAKLHLVMPMAGRGSRFLKRICDAQTPDRDQRPPVFYWATQSIAKFVDCADITFVVLEEHIRDHAIDREIKTYYPDAKIVTLPEVTEAPPSPPCAGRKACRTMSRCSLMTATTCSFASRSMSFARRAILPTARTAHC